MSKSLRRIYIGLALLAVAIYGGVNQAIAQKTGPSKLITPLSSKTGALSKVSVELLPNISFNENARGWGLQDAVVLSSINNSGQFVQLNSTPLKSGKWSHVGTRISNAPVNTELNFHCQLRASYEGEQLRVNAFAYDGAGKTIQNWSFDAPCGTAKWSEFTASIVLPAQTKEFSVWVINETGSKAYVCRPSLKASSGQPKRTSVVSSSTETSGHKARVILARYRECVQPWAGADTGSITFPIPGDYREQIPLTFDVTTEPPSALIGYEIRKREDGINWICEVQLNMRQDAVLVKWDSHVLVPGRVERRPPAVALSAPNIVSPWTRSSMCVQSDDRDIKAKAQQLGSKTNDLETYVREVISFTSKNQGTGVKFDALDAKKALVCGGSCTSRANLAAALLRARGIPARTMSHLPTWFKGDMFEHWLVEYWHPGEGWIWVESTLGQYQPAPNTLAVLAVSSVEDEDLCEDALHLRCIMHGAPYLSGFELTRDLMPSSKLLKNAEGANSAIDCGEIKGSHAEFADLKRAARLNFKRITLQAGLRSQSPSRTASIVSAVRKGSAKTISDELNDRL